MPPRRKVSSRQIEMLVEFAESHLDIALGRFPGGPQAARVTREMWASIAIQLNSVAEGTTKTSDQWRRYWIEFKAKTKAKAADSRRRTFATGGGPNMLAPLNDFEQRVLGIIGPVAVERLPGVHLPIDIGKSSSAANPTSPEPLMEVEWLEQEAPPPLEQQNPESSPSPSLVMQTSGSLEPSCHSDQQSDDFIRDKSAQRSTPPARRMRPQTQKSAQRSTPPARRASAQRQLRRDERVPRWAYELELRRIAAEERHAAAMEAMVDLIRDIRNDVRTYVHRLSSP